MSLNEESLNKEVKLEYVANFVGKEKTEQAADVVSIFNKTEDSQRVTSDIDVDAKFHQNLKGQHSERAKITTQILSNYKVQQEERHEYKFKKRSVILNILLTAVVLLVFSIIACFICAAAIPSFKTEAIIAGLASLTGSLITVLVIIVKYVFPADEERYFNDLVTNIIKNDAEVIKSENEYALGMSKNHKTKD